MSDYNLKDKQIKNFLDRWENEGGRIFMDENNFSENQKKQQKQSRRPLRSGLVINKTNKRWSQPQA